MVVRIDHVQELLDVKCPACYASIVTDEDKAKKIWDRFSVTKASLSRQLFDAKKFVSNLKCRNCIENPVATTNFSLESEPEDD